MTYLICEAVGQARKAGGHYQRFTCGVGKQAKVSLPVAAGEKSHSSRSKWEACFCMKCGVCLVYFVSLRPLNDVSPAPIDLHKTRQHCDKPRASTNLESVTDLQ